MTKNAPVITAPRKRGRPKPYTRLSRNNILRKLSEASDDFSLRMVEAFEDDWDGLLQALINKGLEGNIAALNIIFDRAMEKRAQRVEVTHNHMDVSEMNMEDMMKVVYTYDSMIKAQNESILGEVVEIESHTINSAPPPSEIEPGTETQNSETKCPQEVEAAHDPDAPRYAPDDWMRSEDDIVPV